MQFGSPRDGVTYRKRAGAYGLLVKDYKIACVRIGYSEPYTYDLPGGGIDAGELPQDAVVREFAEETGLVVEVGAMVGDVWQYFVMEDGEPVNNHAHIFEVNLIAENPSLKVEPDHELVWLEPLDALLKLRHDGYACVVMNWLRRQA